MKTFIIAIVVLTLNAALSAQPNTFHSPQSRDLVRQPFLTSDLLRSIKWDSLQATCKSVYECSASESREGLATFYSYRRRGSNYYIMSFNGQVLEFQSTSDAGSKDVEENYFDKELWLEFVHSSLPSLPDSLRLTTRESTRVLKAYYRLLGVGMEDVYGWICEYSSVPRAHPRRKAAIDLASETVKMKRLLNYPNIYVQLYVADILIDSDIMARRYLAGLSPETVESTLHEFQPMLLTKQEWSTIYAIRDSNTLISVCTNGMGSYKTEKVSTKELLSEESISKIPDLYKELRKQGY